MNRWAAWFTVGGCTLFLNAILYMTLGEKNPFWMITVLVLMLWVPITAILAIYWVRHKTRRFARYMVTGDAEKSILGRGRL